MIRLTEGLCAQIAPIELSQQCLCKIRWIYIAVVNLSIHIFDYNLETIFPFR